MSVALNEQPYNDTRLKGPWLSWGRLGWLALTLLAVGVFIASVPVYYHQSITLIYFIVQTLFYGFMTFIPLSIGMGILRARLWDIDTIIRRTLVYSLLTALLLLLYSGSVVLIQALFRLLTGEDSSLAVVASTVVIAALFNPLRHANQGSIDRRFYRRKYDESQTVAAFGDTVRNEVNLNVLVERLITTTEETLQPEHVSLWLRKGGSVHSFGNASGNDVETLIN